VKAANTFLGTLTQLEKENSNNIPNKEIKVEAKLSTNSRLSSKKVQFYETYNNTYEENYFFTENSLKTAEEIKLSPPIVPKNRSSSKKSAN